MRRDNQGSPSETLSIGELEDSFVEQPVGRPFLFQVLCAGDLAAPTVRFGLSGFERVAIGRGDTWRARGDEDQLSIRVADDWVSTAHCTLERRGATWGLCDRGSRNGTRVNGQRVEQRALADGDIVEVGRSFFLFRKQLPALAVEGMGRFTIDTDQPCSAINTLRPGLARHFAELLAVAAAGSEVLLTGPTGSGKDVLANEIHRTSERSGPFIAVNCGALPEHLVESELFGSAKGAFSGALEHRAGLIEAANGGTLFLDEIGDLPMSAQTKLLRVLEEKRVRRVGATDSRPVNFHLIAATHKDLPGMVGKREFRDDLLARLNGYHLELPRLSERREDLGLLLRTWHRNQDVGNGPVDLSSAVARTLLSYSWPRNIRELMKTLSRARAIAPAATIRMEDLPKEITNAQAAQAQPPSGPRLPSADAERRAAILSALEANGGNVSAAARSLGKPRSLVQRWIKRYEIDVFPIRARP